MNELQSTLHHFEACVRADLDGQKRTLSLLEQQIESLHEGGREELEESTRDIQAEEIRAIERARRRERLLQALASHWAIAMGSVTLSSVVQRLEAETSTRGQAARLRELNTELRHTTTVVARTGRKLAALIRVRRQVLADALTLLLSEADDAVSVSESRSVAAPRIKKGALIDAEV